MLHLWQARQADQGDPCTVTPWHWYQTGQAQESDPHTGTPWHWGWTSWAEWSSHWQPMLLLWQTGQAEQSDSQTSTPWHWWQAGQAEQSDPRTGTPCCTYDKLYKLSWLVLTLSRLGTSWAEWFLYWYAMVCIWLAVNKLSFLILLLARLAFLFTGNIQAAFSDSSSGNSCWTSYGYGQNGQWKLRNESKCFIYVTKN